MPPLARYTARRLLQLLPIALVIVLSTYCLLRLAPGDLVDVMAGESGSATPEYMADLRHRFALDQPGYLLFWHYLVNLTHLDLGYSFRNSMPVATLIGQRLPTTLLLMLTSIGVAAVLGIALGALAARFHGRWIDEALSAFATMGFATPLFWVGLMLILVFSVHWRVLPSAGMSTVGTDDDGAWAHVLDVARHLVLPAVTLSLFYLSIYVRMTRSAMLDVTRLDFVRTARAKGLSEWRITLRHILRNALLPIVTVTGLQLSSLLGGSIVVETVFAWPGLGRLAFEAVFQRDLNLLLGVFLCSSLLVVVMNLLIDLLYAVLDPRIEVAA